MRWPGRWEGKWWGRGRKLISSELSSSQGLKLLSPVGFISLCMCHTPTRHGWSKASLAENVGRVLVRLQSSWLRAGSLGVLVLPRGYRILLSCPQPRAALF